MWNSIKTVGSKTEQKKGNVNKGSVFHEIVCLRTRNAKKLLLNSFVWDIINHPTNSPYLAASSEVIHGWQKVFTNDEVQSVIKKCA